MLPILSTSSVTRRQALSMLAIGAAGLATAATFAANSSNEDMPLNASHNQPMLSKNSDTIKPFMLSF